MTSINDGPLKPDWVEYKIEDGETYRREFFAVEGRLWIHTIAPDPRNWYISRDHDPDDWSFNKE